MPRPPRPPRRSTASRLGCAALTAVVVLAGAVGGVVWFLDGSSPAAASRTCTASADGTAWELSADQADNAALIAATSMHRGLPARAATIGLATALQESRLINIDYGDRDSIGLFQQRPSQGWGTVEQIMDPLYSTTRFYDGLVRVPGYADLPVTEAAQAVQRSGFPDAYAQHEGRSRAWASALTGWSAAALDCDLDPATGPADADAVSARVQRDFAGTVTAAVDASAAQGDGLVVALDAAALTGASGGDPVRSGWAVAQWAVAAAEALDVVAVDVAGSRWERGTPGWQAADAAGATGAVDTVTLTLAR
ncbi:hypothetical protein [Cellulomonas hominis]|uniref:hypothetical protein n=1 Tax=Cellulomonas hominis TaxID=156981 RepID=UPI001B977EB4|nr:hypothetical protein [Cellulomonas hominis]VTR78078.1 hypothetical protein CHMI_02854 [Cellulomonas hominis]